MSGRRKKRALIVVGLTIIAVVAIAVFSRSDPPESEAPDGKMVVPVGYRAIDQAFFDILRDHPKTEISKDLFEAIKARKIRYSFESGAPGSNAGFAVFTGAQVIPPQDPSVLIPAMFVRLELVQAAVDDLVARRWLQTVVYHEYQHYLQWKAADGNEKDIHGAHSGGRRLEPEDCKKLWHSELYAYRAECAFVREMGWKSENQVLCDAYDDPQRFSALLRDFMISYMPDVELDQCIPVLQEL